MKSNFEERRDRILNARFFWLALIYTVLVALVWNFAWRGQPPTRHYVAVVEIKPNHRVTASDLRRPPGLVGELGFYMKPTGELDGKYLRWHQSILPGETVAENMLSERPDMQLPDKTNAVTISTDSKLIGLVDAGSPVLLYAVVPEGKSAVSIPATIHAILCDVASNDPKTCHFVVRFPEDQKELVFRNISTLKIAATSVSSVPQP